MQLHIVVVNSASTRYEGYAGEIMVDLDKSGYRDVIIRMDDKSTQVVICPEVIEMDELDSTGLSV